MAEATSDPNFSERIRLFHREFGLTWIDFFDGSDVVVETEVDLSIKQQYLDLVIIRRGSAPLTRVMPDGFEELAAYNLITFKSHRESLDEWAVLELLGHYVNYRKQTTLRSGQLCPPSNYRLYAVCARFPKALARQIPLNERGRGVYDIQGFGMTIRIVVLNQLRKLEANAMLHLFTANEELIRYGRQHYRPHSSETNSLLLNLLKAYSEDPTVNEKLKEYLRKSLDEVLNSLPPEQLRKHLPPEERLKGMSAEERLKGMSAEEVMQALSPATREALRRKLRAKGSS